MKKIQKYFAGKPGVYYDPKQDRLWWLDQGESASWYNLNTKKSYHVNRYCVYTEGIQGELLAVNAREPFVYIGNL